MPGFFTVYLSRNESASSQLTYVSTLLGDVHLARLEESKTLR